MKTNYFTKVENKYVFNVSLIFWHLFIALSTIAIMLSIIVFLWSVIPPMEHKAEKQAYPAKKEYPEPVKVLLSELKLEVVKPEEAPQPQEPLEQAAVKPEAKEREDTRGKTEYEASLNTLKTLIPPTKYSWTGSGYWSYPNGERYWTFYKQEKYRQWNISEAGIEDKLKSSYKISNASSFAEKKQILDGYITVVKLLQEASRLDALQYLMNNMSDNIAQNLKVCQAITKVVAKMQNEINTGYINELSAFSKNNPTDGSPFIDFVSTIIDKFNVQQRVKIIENLANSYYNFFNQDLGKLKESTELIVPMLNQINGENQSKTLMQYYRLYQAKNSERDMAISQINAEYQDEVAKIDSQYTIEQMEAAMKYQQKKMNKTEYRYKSLIGIGGGIFFIVLITTILVFLSIQRSVRKIEEKITQQTI